MKRLSIFNIFIAFIVTVVAVVLADSCQLPNCRRPSPSVPGSLRPNEVPQMVVFTFDSGVSRKNFKHLKPFFGPEMRNPNGCPMHYTFFTSGYANDNSVSSKLYKDGHELASGGLTNKSKDYWVKISSNNFQKEMVGMLRKLEKYSSAEVFGVRAPDLGVGGDAAFEIIKNNFHWDSSMLIGETHPTKDLPIWPYTLDYPVPPKYCVYGNCPKKAYPGLWEYPVHRLYTDYGTSCSLAESCYLPFDAAYLFDFLKNNFLKNYYNRNRAPFTVSTDITWFRHPSFIKAAEDFLQYVSKLGDVYVVTVSQAIEWVKNPTPLSKISNFPPWTCGGQGPVLYIS